MIVRLPQNTLRGMVLLANRSFATLNKDGPSVFQSVNGPSQEIRLNIDPKRVSKFSQLQLQKSIVSALEHNFDHSITKPTKVQKNMLAALKSDLSVLVRSAPGCGKSLATAVYILSNASTNTNNGEITNLILVPSEHLAAQYYLTFKRLLGNNDRNGMVQQLYRAKNTLEQEQIARLKETTPRILIATPTRLLDILSSQYRNLLPLYNLSCVAIDEADHLLPPEKYLNRSKSSIISTKSQTPKPPTDILMSHLASWRASFMKKQNVAYSPLRLILESSTASSYLRDLSPGTTWVGQRPIVKVGLDSSNGQHTNRLPRDVEAFAVSYNPTTKELHNTQLPDLSVEEALLPSTSYVLANSQKVVTPKGSSSIEAFEAFAKVFALEKRKRGILIIPPQMNAGRVRKELEKRKITAAYSRLQNDGGNMAYFDSQKDQWQTIEDPQSFFLKPHESNEPEVLIYDTQKALGLDFPGLSRVYILTWSAANNSARKFLTLAGRCRLCKIHQRGERGRDGLWIPPAGQERGKVITIEIDNKSSETVNRQISLAMTKLDVDVGDYSKTVDMK